MTVYESEVRRTFTANNSKHKHLTQNMEYSSEYVALS
jgi:hypothetical protein